MLVIRVMENIKTQHDEELDVKMGAWVASFKCSIKVRCS